MNKTRKIGLNKIFSFLLALLMIMSFSMSAFAGNIPQNTIREKEIIINNGETIELDLVEVEEGYEGTYIFEIPSQTRSSTDSAEITFKATKNNTYGIPRAYDITYTIKATSLVNGIAGNIVIKDNTALSPEIHYDEPYSKTFGSTKLYYGSVGIFVFPSTAKSAQRLQFTNSKIYFLNYGWISGMNFLYQFNL